MTVQQDAAEQGVINRAVSEFARSRPHATFIQIGAHDGVQRDPLRRHIENGNWSGIMVEPVPYVFERLRGRYEHHPRVTLENVAIADTDGFKTLYFIPESSDPGLWEWYDALASFRKDVLLKHVSVIPDIAERISSIDVPCVTFDTLCARNSVDQVDLIQIDTEGFDYEVIKRIDFRRYKPTLIVYESLHLGDQDAEACAALLRQHGFQLITDGMDTVGLRTAALGPADARLRLAWLSLAARQAATTVGRRGRRSSAARIKAGGKRLFAAAGLDVRRHHAPSESRSNHRVFDPQLHRDERSAPPGSELVLHERNPRLINLRERYAALDWPVCEHSRWRRGNVAEWVNLRYFRGDNIYVWQYRESSLVDDLKFFVFLRYVSDRDTTGLLATLGEDGAFGCWSYDFPGYPRCSRDLLDSVNELLFLDRNLSVLDRQNLRVLDIGAGYGRMAYRTSQAVPGLASYVCVDAVPESTFLCEYYLNYRDVAPPAQVLDLPDVVGLAAGSFDLAINVHSFSECTRAAVQWWMEQVSRLQVPYLFIVPNEADGFLTTEVDGSRQDYRSVVEAHGYRLLAEERMFDDESVRRLIGVDDRYCLFTNRA